jgi:hypothetical protein
MPAVSYLLIVPCCYVLGFHDRRSIYACVEADSSKFVANALGIFFPDLYGMTPFSFVFTVSCEWAGVRITLASAGGSACVAITPVVRLQQVKRVLIDWLID